MNSRNQKYKEQIREISKEEPTERLILRLKDVIEELHPISIGIVEELEKRWNNKND